MLARQLHQRGDAPAVVLLTKRTFVRNDPYVKPNIPFDIHLKNVCKKHSLHIIHTPT